MIQNVPIERRSGTDRRQTERREDAREVADAEIRFLFGHSPDRVRRGRLLDVSRQGIRFRMAENIDIGDVILVEVQSGSTTCLNLSAEVLWTAPLVEELRQVGCRLRLPLTLRQRDILRQLSSPIRSNAN